ncbi:unnamed protein product [Heterobilharzia americana]|nr:unnamed protein product [Heterobilharzia americana]
MKSVVKEAGKYGSNSQIRCLVFRRLARKGTSRGYSNCGNRLISLLEVGFFRQKFMPKGPVEYDRNVVTHEDRDVCLYLLTLWLKRVKNRFFDRQAERLFRLLTTALSETQLLRDLLFPPETSILIPYFIRTGYRLI